MTSTSDPDWFGGDVQVVGGRDQFAQLHVQAVWASTGVPLTDDELERMRDAGEANPVAVWRFFLNVAGLEPA